MSNSVRPHRQQPTRLHHPWDSPDRNTGVGCHFLLQCMKVKSESEVAQLCPTLSNPMDCSLLGFSIHGIFQVRVLEWVAIAFSVIVNEATDKELISNIYEHFIQFAAAAATAKSLQSCLTFCDLIDGSPPGSPCPWDSPGKNTGVGCHFLLHSLA